MSTPMLAALEALVRVESPTEDLDACRDVVRLASDIATRVTGTPAQIIEHNGRPVFWWGAQEPEIVLLAHLDTVWPKGSFEPLWEIKGDVLRGPGTFDMKAGFIQALFAIKDIKGSVALIGTTDEETGSKTSKDLIEKVSRAAKAVLVLESAIDGKVKVGRKGTSMYQIKVIGRAAHAGVEPEKGINATTELAHIILGTSVVPTTMKAGNSTNTVPDLAVLDIDARSFLQSELLRIDKAIREIKALHPEAKIEIGGGINRPPLELAATAALYQRAKKVAEKIGMPELGSASVGGASDGNFAGAVGAQVLDGLGAVGGGAHAPSEWISVAALEERSNLLNALVLDLINE